VLQISSNLNLALHRLVSPGDFRYLWIDQICINQKDDGEEKATQIRSMHLIYGNAENVAVWLGEAPEGMQHALDLIPSIQNGLNNIDGIFLVNQANFESHGLPEVSSPVWQTLGAIFGSSWFERLWTLQEVVFGRKLKFQMGSYLLDWDVLSSLAFRIAKANLSFHMRGETAMPKDRAGGFTAVQPVCQKKIKAS
jgi:Heterokaryon incompatibility protein (HET)